MAVLTQTITTETAINWEELAQKIKDNTSALKVGDIITEKTLDGEEMDEKAGPARSSAHSEQRRRLYRLWSSRSRHNTELRSACTKGSGSRRKRSGSPARCYDR